MRCVLPIRKGQRALVGRFSGRAALSLAGRRRLAAANSGAARPNPRAYICRIFMMASALMVMPMRLSPASTPELIGTMY